MRWLLAVFLLFTAGSLFFFGYIELYALSYACGAVYFLAVWAVFRSGASPWPAGVALLAAVAFGLSAAVFVPSWLLVLHWKFRGESGPFPLKHAAAALCVLSVLVFVAAYVVTGAANEEMQLMPLAPFQKTTGGVPGGWQQYTLFSRAHLVDMLNALLLVAGPALAVCVAALAVARRASAWRDPAVLTGLVAAVGGVLFVFFGHARLGLARDWDLAALPLLGLAFLAASLLAALAKEGKIVLAPLLPLLLALALGDTWVWMRVNIDEDASARRLESIVDRDAAVLLPIHTYTALENLRKHYRALRSEDHHVATLKRMIATGYHKPDTYEKFLGVLAQRRSPEERGRDLSWVFERLLAESASMNGPAGYAVVAPRTLRELAAKALLIGAQTGESGRVRDVLPRFRAALEPWKEAGLVEAFVTPGLTPDDVADRVAAAIDSATADAALLIAAARVHRAAARYAAAATLYERAITRDPDGYPESYIALAQICFEQLGDRARSEDALRRCLAQAPGSAEAAEARRILLLMQQQR
ncbi:MAG: tetratricopeptide repeat protein [Ignavibacteria bacterium]|nr:tetratricopeptide repeat protein [Ignavibacteria bacterium]